MSEAVATDAQADFAARLNADAFFVDVPVFHEQTGDLLDQVNKALGVMTKKGGKVGACVIVQQPIGTDDYPNVLGGPLELEYTFLVLVDPAANSASNGTRKSGWQIARRVHRVMKMFASAGFISLLSPAKPTIVPVQNPLAQVAYEVRLKGSEADSNVEAHVSPPSISPASGAAPQTVTLTCVTAGAEIRYTLDGSYPSPTATLYTDPIEIATAKTLRCCAYKTGSIASNVNRAIYT